MPTPRFGAAARFAAALFSLSFTLVMVGDAHAATRIQDACGTAPVGYVRCEAQIVVSAANAKPVRPKLGAITTGIHARSVSHIAGASVATEPLPDTPLYLQQAYDLTALSGTQGTNQTVAVVDAYNDPSIAADLSTFRGQAGLSACSTTNGCLRVLNESGAAAPLPANNVGWSVEESLDVDAVSSLCPNCKIVLVEASASDNTDMQRAIQAAVSAGATFVSNSWSAEATSSPFSSNFTYPGVSILAAAGDAGTSPAGQSAYPAALPSVTAVGGTSLEAGTPNPRGFVETAWDDTGSGCDTYESVPAWQSLTGCNGRAYNDLSADGDPNTGLAVFDSQDGGWLQVGGSSLAAPLAAAFEAVTGLNGTTPQWAYTDESLLNGVDSGSNGSCAIALICNATTGWDGPGGAGSISGDVVQGVPGIGGPNVNYGAPSTSTSPSTYTYTESVTSTTAALQAGIYPNGEATSYYWQYGATTAYGSQTTAVTLPAGSAAVSVAGALAALAPSSFYHYRLVASNASGTSYGYDFTLTTTAAPPAQTVVTKVVPKPVIHTPVKSKPVKRKVVKHKHKPTKRELAKRRAAKREIAKRKAAKREIARRKAAKKRALRAHHRVA